MVAVRRLYVLMNGVFVGVLSKLPSGGLTFTYDNSWLESQGARPISLSLPLRRQAYAGDTVYNFFDNLLPDNEQLRARLQTRFQVKTATPFDLLASIGRDCVGAIQLVNDRDIPSVKQGHAELLNDADISDVLRNYQQAPLGMSEGAKDFRISIAGAQEKTAFLKKDGQWYRPMGTTPTSHIFKLPIGFIEHAGVDLSDSCENEWLCLKIAEAFGLPVNTADICYFDDVKALVVKRFDRKPSSDGAWLMRLPQEDMCQAMGLSPHIKYENEGGPGIQKIMTLLLGSEDANHDRDQFFQSQVLFWLLAAIDGHAKNFSLFLQPDSRFRLTPLYDIMSAYPFIANKQLQKDKIKMAMALTGKNKHYHFRDIQRRYFFSTAKAANYSEKAAGQILNTMREQVEYVIKIVTAQLHPKFPATIAEPIFNGMREARDRLSDKTALRH